MWVLTSRTLVQDVLIDAWTAPDIDSVNISGALPAQSVSLAVEGRDSLPASGSLRLPSQPAAGTVTFTNLTDQPVEIPQGSGVRGMDPGIARLRFVTTRPGEVPAGAGQTLQLPVECVTPGLQGNLPAGSLAAIEGLLGTQLSVTNLEPTQRRQRTPIAGPDPERPAEIGRAAAPGVGEERLAGNPGPARTRRPADPRQPRARSKPWMKASSRQKPSPATGSR